MDDPETVVRLHLTRQNIFSEELAQHLTNQYRNSSLFITSKKIENDIRDIAERLGSTSPLSNHMLPRNMAISFGSSRPSARTSALNLSILVSSARASIPDIAPSLPGERRSSGMNFGMSNSVPRVSLSNFRSVRNNPSFWDFEPNLRSVNSRLLPTVYETNMNPEVIPRLPLLRLNEDIPMVLTERAMDNLLVLSYNEIISRDLEGQNCSICLDGLAVIDLTCVMLPCNHIYHKDCILHHLRMYDHRCPQCRMSSGERTPRL